ncbi:MAG TPA: extracellular solute-binding protein [Acidimicrobiales bacterium]|nr:extracellular solute-binding protein [Acidimicrobiales bacterium]
MTLRLALVGGPMYDGLYSLVGDDVEVVIHADHPTLNRRAAELLAAGERIDVLSTHAKYAPSQARWLRPLDDLVPARTVDALQARAVELCRFEGALLSVPRNIDVRVLWWRTDRMAAPPSTWSDVVDSGISFGFPGRESGLFGTFFELVVGAGGALFDGSRPTILGQQSVAAVELLCRLASTAPPDLPGWHYDEVDAALLEGRVDAAAAWPGSYGAIAACPVAGVLRPAPYPAGPARWVSYAGCHSWAIPRTCGDLDGAVELICRLVSEEAAIHDAEGGSIPAHAAVLDRLITRGDAASRRSEVDAERLAVTRRTITEAMIVYPSLARFPAVEDAGWQALNRAITGRIGPAEAVRQMQAAAEAALE